MPGRPPDVVVAGGGNAALCAAISARRAGASVTLLEKADEAWRGGNSKYTRNIRIASERYPAAELLNDLIEVTGDDIDLELARMTVELSEHLPAWMEQQGIRWQPALRGTLQLDRTNRFFLGGGKALLNAYYRMASAIGVDVRYESEVTDIQVSGTRCTGVGLRAKHGTINLPCRALVVASGGFEANLEWLRRRWGEAVDRFSIRGSAMNDGRLLEQLFDLGALARGNDRGFHAVAVDARAPRFEGGIVTRVDSIPFSVVLNQEGRRFSDEGEDLWPKRYASWGQLIAEQPGQRAWSFYDSRVAGTFIAGAYPSVTAGSIPALAEKVGLDALAVTDTIDQYNRSLVACEYDPSALDGCHTEGITPAKSHWALPIDRPPFHCHVLIPGITFTYLGVAVDRQARVCRKAGGSFENIFAAGEAMAGNLLRRGYLGGFGMTIGTVFGRLAGEGAAALARS